MNKIKNSLNNIRFSFRILVENFWWSIVIGVPFIIVSGFILNDSIYGYDRAIELGFTDYITYVQPFAFSISMMIWCRFVIKKLLVNEIRYPIAHTILLSLFVAVISIVLSFVYQHIFFTAPIADRLIFWANIVSNQGNLLVTPVMALLFLLIYTIPFKRTNNLPKTLGPDETLTAPWLLTFLAPLVGIFMFVIIEVMYWIITGIASAMGVLGTYGWSPFELSYHPVRQTLSYLTCLIYINLSLVLILKDFGFKVKTSEQA